MRKRNCSEHPEIRDYGGEPFIFNIRHATEMNENFRTALWTGQDMQLTLMSIPVCGANSIRQTVGSHQSGRQSYTDTIQMAAVIALQTRRRP